VPLRRNPSNSQIDFVVVRDGGGGGVLEKCRFDMFKRAKLTAEMEILKVTNPITVGRHVVAGQTADGEPGGPRPARCSPPATPSTSWRLLPRKCWFIVGRNWQIILNMRRQKVCL